MHDKHRVTAGGWRCKARLQSLNLTGLPLHDQAPPPLTRFCVTYCSVQFIWLQMGFFIFNPPVASHFKCENSMIFTLRMVSEGFASMFESQKQTTRKVCIRPESTWH